jgi:pimeloyl-ACP methyl ester carboxylesterase
MLARDMRIAQLCELVIYACLAYWLHREGMPGAACVALVPAFFLASRLVITGAMFALAWLLGMRRAPAESIGVVAGIAMVLREYAAFVKLNFLGTPWERWALKPDPRADAQGGQPVILVHGYFANRACWAPLVRALEGAGLGPVYAPSLRSHFASIEEFEEDLHAVVERVANGRRVALVAHSMGGLASRLYVARHGSARIARLVTISSPHQGTRLAAFGAGRNARQMVPGSAFLAALREHESRGAVPPTLCIYSVHDNMILPQDSARLPWARNVAVKALGHISQFGDDEIARLVIEELRGR